MRGGGVRLTGDVDSGARSIEDSSPPSIEKPPKIWGLTATWINLVYF